MKKNAMLKIAAVLLVAVLLTTCAISSTFAKYVTDGIATTDTAKVAKWGVEVNMSSTALKLFEGTNDTGVAEATTDRILVAPGTTNTMQLGATISGTPEVAGKVRIFAYVESNLDTYKPVTVKLGDQTVKYGTEFAETNLIKEYQFAPGTDIAATYDDMTISYNWPFEVAGNDQNDTDLGDAACEDDLYITVKVKIEVVQIDTYSN